MPRGLTSTQAADLLKRHGPNELPTAAPKSVWRIAMEVIREPMFLLLIGCGTLYMILGDYQEGAVLMSAIFLIIGITFFQHRKTERALDALKNLSSPRALVIRDGKEKRIAGREVVVGDRILLQEGDRVPADARIIDAHGLHVDESLLTGESVPVAKVGPGSSANGEAISPTVSTAANDHSNVIFSGTLVVRGRGEAEVHATGAGTEFGKIGATLGSIAPQPTRLQREMGRFVRTVAFIAIGITVLVILLFYLTRGNFLQSLLNGLSSAMAILPEEFPVVFTVFMALGAWRLSRKQVLTRVPAAIETLGTATVLCSDKTGTITQNQMTVTHLSFDGMEMEVSDLGHNAAAIHLIRIAQAASQPGTIDPMELAILNAAKANGAGEMPQVVHEYAIGHGLLAMSHILPVKEEYFPVATKGAPEAVFKLCKLSGSDLAEAEASLQRMAAQGLRVIGVAEGRHPAEVAFPETQAGFELRFLGLLGLEDPVRPEVPEAIAQCHTAGIRVVMITGDNPETARSIGAQIGLPEQGRIMTGKDLTEMDDAALQVAMKDVHICARVAPEQKLRIVRALQAAGEVVAMTGDGVNDAPALKAADIGVAMGKKGTDVAREAAALVLLDDNFASIVGAIRLGRRIFDNLQKAMAYIIAIHIPIIGFALLPAFFASWPLLLLPLHIVFMELIIDPVCSVAFESEPDELGVMSRPPRPSKEVFFGGRNILSSLAKGLLLLVTVLAVYLLSVQEGHTVGEVRAIAFTSLIIGNVFLIFALLSKTRNVFSVIREGNWAALGMAAGAMVLLLLLLLVPPLRTLFGFEFPGWQHFLPSIAGAAGMLTVLEVWKLIRRGRG
ncbi:MAG: cation-translocating P-type ATPase [Bacteroidia bacterium]